MMKQYIVDTLAVQLFHGNPAAVCIMEDWPDDEILMKIAEENHLSETSFVVWEDGQYHLRWFNAVGEMNLCGYGAIAAGFVLLSFYEPDQNCIVFSTACGELTVTTLNGLYALDLPESELSPVPVTDAIAQALGVRPVEALLGRDLVCVLPTEQDVLNLTPDLTKIAQLDGFFLHVTAKCGEESCISRTFASKFGLSEGPMSISGHCQIVPYWMDRLSREHLTAHQGSERSGTLYCRRKGGRIIMGGNVVLFSQSELNL